MNIDVPGLNYRPCRSCAAPMVDPFPDTWDVELIKEGPNGGPTTSFVTPHTADCDVPTSDPQPGIAVRVKGNYVAHINIDPPPVPPRTAAPTDRLYAGLRPDPGYLFYGSQNPAQDTPDGTPHGAMASDTWVCTRCGYHNVGGVCTRCGQVVG